MTHLLTSVLSSIPGQPQATTSCAAGADGQLQHPANSNPGQPAFSAEGWAEQQQRPLPYLASQPGEALRLQTAWIAGKRVMHLVPATVCADQAAGARNLGSTPPLFFCSFLPLSVVFLFCSYFYFEFFSPLLCMPFSATQSFLCGTWACSVQDARAAAAAWARHSILRHNSPPTSPPCCTLASRCTYVKLVSAVLMDG